MEDVYKGKLGVCRMENLWIIFTIYLYKTVMKISFIFLKRKNYIKGGG